MYKIIEKSLQTSMQVLITIIYIKRAIISQQINFAKLNLIHNIREVKLLTISRLFLVYIMFEESNKL